MKKKDLLVIIMILITAAILYLGVQFYIATQKKEEQIGLVYHQDKIILAFDIHVDKIYDYQKLK